MLIDYLIPVLLLWLLCAAAWKRLPMYELFVTGARSGLNVAYQVLPNLAGMLVAISLMRASGLMDALCALIAPAFAWLGLPPEVAPLALIRPLSGSASLGLLESLLREHGADSRIGNIASVVTGSGEAVFYVICVYTAGLKRHSVGYAVPCALAGELFGVCLAGWLF